MELDQSDNFKHIVFEESLIDSELWGDTSVRVPQNFAGSSLTNLFTSEKVDASDRHLLVSKLFNSIPVCVLSAT